MNRSQNKTAPDVAPYFVALVACALAFSKHGMVAPAPAKKSS